MATNQEWDRNAALRVQWLEADAAFTKAEAEGRRVASQRWERARKRIEYEFVIANRGLAMSVARKFLRPSERDFHDDYVNAALAGLWEAFLKWDPERSTFGNWSRQFIAGWVNRSVQECTAPDSSYGDWTFRPMLRIERDALTERLGRKPTPQELAASAHVTPGLVARVEQPRPASLDAPVGDGDNARVDVVAADTTGDDRPAVTALDDERVERDLAAALDRAELSPVELFVTIRRLGLGGTRPQTLVEIGHLVGLGRETVRRHEASATVKLHDLASV